MKRMTFTEYRELKAKKENRKRKLKEFMQLFFIMIGFMAFMVIVGTAGASDLNNITYVQVKIQLSVALTAFIASSLIAKKLGSK